MEPTYTFLGACRAVSSWIAVVFYVKEPNDHVRQRRIQKAEICAAITERAIIPKRVGSFIGRLVSVSEFIPAPRWLVPLTHVHSSGQTGCDRLRYLGTSALVRLAYKKVGDEACQL